MQVRCSFRELEGQGHGFREGLDGTTRSVRHWILAGSRDRRAGAYPIAALPIQPGSPANDIGGTPVPARSGRHERPMGVAIVPVVDGEKICRVR